MRQVLVAAAILLCMLGKAEAAPTNVRVYVLYGQGGDFMSRGIRELAAGLEKMDSRLQVSVHEWKNHKEVAKDIAALPADTPIVLIGYSLGANATTWISNAVAPRAIDLIVAYDPSVLMKVESAGSNVRRVLLYHNTSAEPWGHARIRGPRVETTETRNSHLVIADSKWLHKKTRAAVSRVLTGPEER
jgi:hypothetical protein